MGRIPFSPFEQAVVHLAALMAGFEGSSGGGAASRGSTARAVRSALAFERCCANLVCSCSAVANRGNCLA